MKKRAMKKYIPKNTDYCTGCKNFTFYKMQYDEFTVEDTFNENQMVTIPSFYPMFKCRYTGLTTDDPCLFDSIKICGIGKSKDFK